MYLTYHCIATVQCNSSGTTAVHYTTYHYNSDAVFAVCTYIARPPSLASRRSPATTVVGYTRLYTASVPCAINTVPYLYYVLLLYYCCCICCVHIHRSPAAACAPPLLLVIHGYTQQLYEVLLTLYLARLLYYVLLSAVCTYDIPPSVCIAFLLSRRRSPAAGLVRYTQQYTAVRFLVH